MNYEQVMEEYYDQFDENFDCISKVCSSLDKAQDPSNVKKNKNETPSRSKLRGI